MTKIRGIDAPRPEKFTWRSLGANQTRFFRFPGQYNMLHKHLVGLLQRTSEIKILSAGASTGEEPISILLTFFRAVEEVRQKNPDMAEPKLEIVAVDINQKNIDVFMGNKFSFSIKFHKETMRDWQRFFTKLPGGEIYPGPDIYQVSLKPEFQRMITYVKADLRNKTQFASLVQKYGRSFTAVFFNVVSLYMPYNASQRIKAALQSDFLAQDGLFLNND